MIVKLQVLYDDINQDGGRERDSVIRAVDGAMGNATWEANKEGGWTVRR